MIAPKSGAYPYRTAITLNAEDESSEIRYTLDGTTPDRESLVYTAPIVMSQPVGTSLVVRAIAVQSDGRRSAEIRGDYTIEPGLVIHFRKPADWSSPSFYFWDPMPGPLTTLWPGIAMLPENTSDAEGWYYATLKGQVEANFLFNGNDRPQTEDIYWSKEEGWFDEWEWMDISPEAMRRYTTCCLFPNARPKALIMSFDDGREQDARLIEIFDRYGIKGSFHLNSGSLGARDIASVYDGHEVSSHSVHHPYLNDMTRAQLEAEVLQDRLNLEALVGYPVRGMAYPFGSYNTTLLRSMNDFGLVYGRVVPTTKDFRLPYDLLRWRGTCHHSEASGLVDAFWATPPTDMALFFIWGHSWEFDRNEANNSWAYIEALADRLSGRHDDVWYASVGEVADYLLAMRALKFSADVRSVTNPSAAPVWVKRSDGSAVEVLPGAHLAL